MTCIVGYVDKQKNVWIGGDSAGVSPNCVRLRKDTKVFRNGDMIFGYTSSFRMGQLLRFKLEIPVNHKKDDYEYMCTEFIDAVRKCLKENGYTTVKENTESIGTFLVGYRGKLYSIDDDLQVGEVIDNYDACGCGIYYAYGALNILKGNPKNIILRALETAEKFSTGVRRPFNIEKLEYKK